MKTNLKKQNRRGKEEGEQPDTQVDDDYLCMGQLELYNFKKRLYSPGGPTCNSRFQWQQ